MNRFLTLEEEIQRIKEMHNKSILIESKPAKKTIDGDEIEKGKEIITSAEESEENDNDK